ncbi:hypothetical protein DAPPUDRAFT_103764 [Daphnia pulex]|uniref:Uncharacterized protein n=1 Tax=Daphnia pulex TaxID=6669 RepID=E9GK76_DAPPU|nr:hypothetical protein DAPPUDRAFT_103764 [Daphnia pulex]|eukprot:EFX80109.1 hypothetical protein DAPPUDRAFT_103764 [Daphnia pulex]
MPGINAFQLLWVWRKPSSVCTLKIIPAEHGEDLRGILKKLTLKPQGLLLQLISQECSSVAQALKDVDHPYLSIAEDKSKASTSLLSLMRTTWSSMREQILSKPSTFACHSNCLLLKTVVPAFFLANKFSSMPRLAPLSPYSLTIFWLKAVSSGPTNHVAVIDLYSRGNTPFHFNVHPIFMS